MKVLAAMQSRYRPVREGMDDWKLQKIDVEVNDVELVGALTDPLKHQHVMREGVVKMRIQSQADIGARDEFSLRFRVAASEKRNIVSLLHQFFR
jgi:hypothetical protein